MKYPALSQLEAELMVRRKKEALEAVCLRLREVVGRENSERKAAGMLAGILTCLEQEEIKEPRFPPFEERIYTNERRGAYRITK